MFYFFILIIIITAFFLGMNFGRDEYKKKVKEEVIFEIDKFSCKIQGKLRDGYKKLKMKINHIFNGEDKL